MNRNNWGQVIAFGVVALLVLLLVGGVGGPWGMMGPGMMGRWGFGPWPGVIFMLLIPLGLLGLLTLGVLRLVKGIAAPGERESAAPRKVCPNCEQPVQNEWQICPYCRQELK